MTGVIENGPKRYWNLYICGNSTVMMVNKTFRTVLLDRIDLKKNIPSVGSEKWDRLIGWDRFVKNLVEWLLSLSMFLTAIKH